MSTIWNKLGDHARQGDVLITLISRTPTKPDNGIKIPMSALGPVLALGEVTGHHHTVVAQPERYSPTADGLSTELVQELGESLAQRAEGILDRILRDAADRAEGTRTRAKRTPAATLYAIEGEINRTLVVDRPTLLRHDEHGAIALDPGTYRIVIQVEETLQGLRQVLD